MIWNREQETLPRKKLEELQLERLQRQVRLVYEKVPFYRQAMEVRGVRPEHIRKLADITLLPFTTKKDFRDNYPTGLMAAPRDEIVRLHASSGTTGHPVVAAYTKGDVETWTELMARVFTAGGLRKGDTMQNAHGYGLFTGGLGFHYGAERVGATVVPSSVGNTKRQIMLIQDLGVTALGCTPSYALIIAETAAEMGVDLRRSKLRLGFHGAEPWSNQMRQEIESKLGISATDVYGLTEVLGPGVAAECTEKDGLHLAEDHFLAEIVDPDTGEPLPYGKQGELVLTTLTKEGMPLLRFRTRDITWLNREPCRCGRTLARMAKVRGRTDDMLIIRGVNVFPSQIESVLLAVEGVEPHYLIVVDRQRHLDDLEVWVEVPAKLFTDELAALETLEQKIRAELESVLGLSSRVRLVEPGTIERSEGKAKRVIDRRQMQPPGGLN